MRIIIDDVDSGEVSITFEKSFAEEPGSSFQKVQARLMVALEGTIKEFIRKTPVKDKDAFMDHLYDIVDDHTATCAWYIIDRHTLIGTDELFETEIDFSPYAETD